MICLSTRRPRVLYFINGFKRGGAERGLLHLVQHGAFDGCDLTVVSIIADQGAHVEDLRACGVSVRHLSEGSRMTPWLWARSVGGFRKALRQLKPDLLILSLPQANIAGRVAAMTIPGVVVASFEHNTHLAKPIYERLFRLTSRRVDWLLADCERTAAVARERLYTHAPKRQFVLPLAAFPRTDARQSFQEKPFKIINAARFTDTKNQRVIIEGTRLLLDRGYEVAVTLFGEGPNGTEYDDLVDELDLTNVVEMPGFDPNWMNYPAHLFVVTSKNEGLCIVALEAMSQGVPVMATRVGGLADYGPAAKVTFLDACTASEFATAVAALIDDPANLTQMRDAGLQLIREQYSERSVRAKCQAFASEVSALTC